MKKLTIATRGSKLALWQSKYIKSVIESNHADVEVEPGEVVIPPYLESVEFTFFLSDPADIPQLKINGAAVDPDDLVNLAFLQGYSNEPIGYPRLWLATTLPSADWVAFEGQLLSRTEYATLFALYGTAYGAADRVSRDRFVAALAAADVE